MKKRSRKPSSAQRDRAYVEAAKVLKKRGILSKQTKLHGGKFISQRTLKKVRDLSYAVNSDYKAHRVPKKLAEQAKAAGYVVVQGNRIIGPPDRKFSRALHEGRIAGVAPVKGGSMVHIDLPQGIMDLRGMNEADLNALKNPGEFFAFRYHGYMTHVAQPDAGRLLKYLTHYKGINDAYTGRLSADQMQEEIAAFELFRLNPEDTGKYIPSRAERERAAKGRKRTQQDRRQQRLTKAQKREHKSPKAQERELRAEAERSARRRAQAMSTEAKREAYLQKERERRRKKPK